MSQARTRNTERPSHTTVISHRPLHTRQTPPRTKATTARLKARRKDIPPIKGMLPTKDTSVVSKAWNYSSQITRTCEPERTCISLLRALRQASEGEIQPRWLTSVSFAKLQTFV